jgi:hypothetical protein
MPLIQGGRTVYGQALGILMLDTVFPRVRGDVGNALTWPFPVLYKVVKGATSNRIMGKEPDTALIQPFLDAARELEAEGVRAITTSCGFLAIFQREIAAAVSLPVLTSSLLQVPIVARLIRPDQSVGILTERPHLTAHHFSGAGWQDGEIPVRVGTLAPDAVFPTVFIDGGREADPEVLERDVVEGAVRLARQHPDVGAIVMECTNFVPFSQAVRRATGLPVFDLYTFVTQVYHATVGTDFSQAGGVW